MSTRMARVAGWGLVAVTGGISAFAIVVGAGYGGPSLTALVVALAIAISLAYSLIGALILSRRPGNGLGWVFAFGGVAAATFSITQEYAADALSADAGSVSGRVAAWVTDISNPVSIGLLTVFVYLLFPKGRFESTSRRRAAVVAAVGIVLAMTGAILEPTLQEYGDLSPPFAPAIPAAIPWTLLGLGIAFYVGALVPSIAILVRRLRRATGRERDQLRILVWATGAATVMLAPALVAPAGASWTRAAYVVGGFGFLLVPTAVGVAILRHGLLDLDLVIRRTVVVAILGAFITAVYVAVVVGAGTLVGRSGNAVLSAVAAAVVALAFQPVRRGAQHLANRLVYGKRATPYEVLHEFAERVAGSYGTDDVLPRMAAILGEGTAAERAQIWLRFGAELRPAEAWPSGVRRSRPVGASDGDPLAIPDVSHAVPVRHEGELLGALSITKTTSDPVTPTEEKLLSDLAHQAGLVLRNARLVEDLRASRQRLVTAQDEERRRLERNIHDGAQQQLVALQVKQRLAEQVAERDPAKAIELLRQLQVETGQALQDLRDLARGIYPPLLADQGLPEALEAQARKATVLVEVRSEGVGRYPQEVEATVYFCCLEAIQNAAKYAEASSVRITLEATDGGLRFEVADDGRGFDPIATRWGAGLQNMIDRLEAIGGSFHMAAAPGEGTRVAGRIPIATV
ncbi:MAG TPA: GAF domain-containing sensor histidine kinase [Actinomycetota bacterium]|nr:GAF domain-containing sensor histidine kinase [Actinomycetota bacterium]